MKSSSVVENLDVIEDGVASRVACIEHDSIDKLFFDGSKETLGNGVVPAVAFCEMKRRALRKGFVSMVLRPFLGVISRKARDALVGLTRLGRTPLLAGSVLSAWQRLKLRLLPEMHAKRLLVMRCSAEQTCT